jgi:hypothetical protein
VDRLAQEWNGRVQVVRVNVHDPASRPLLTRLGFRFTPTYILLDTNGREAWRTSGVLNPTEATRMVNTLD